MRSIRPDKITTAAAEAVAPVRENMRASGVAQAAAIREIISSRAPAAGRKTSPSDASAVQRRHGLRLRAFAAKGERAEVEALVEAAVTSVETADRNAELLLRSARQLNTDLGELDRRLERKLDAIRSKG